MYLEDVQATWLWPETTTSTAGPATFCSLKGVNVGTVEWYIYSYGIDFDNSEIASPV